MQKQPKVEVCICMGSSCFSRGNNSVLTVLKDYLKNAGLEEAVKLQGCLCMDMCKRGPNISIDSKRYDKVDAATVVDVLRHRLKELQFSPEES